MPFFLLVAGFAMFVTMRGELPVYVKFAQAG